MKLQLTARRSEWGLLILIACAALMGGSSRSDISSLIVLRPVAILALAWGLYRLSGAQARANTAVLYLAGAWFGLTALQLVPLPPFLWHALPGRELAQEIDRAAGLADQWRPLSLVPWRTLNTLFALTVPLAALVLALGMPRSRLRVAIAFMVLIVWLSAGLSLLQVVGGDSSPFYTYRVTNAGSAVGLFANRNHQAIFIAMGFPLIATALALWPVSREQIRLREWTAAGITTLLVPFLLFTQSRAGIVVGLIGAGLAVWCYRSPREAAQPRRRKIALDPRIIFAGLATLALVGLTLAFSAANSIQRLGAEDDELRLSIWPPIFDMALSYLPTGSGLGTFVEIYATNEPDDLLAPQYINHAHNDYLELLMTGGLPFIGLLAIAAAVVFGKAAARLRRRGQREDQILGRLGVSLILILAIGSAYDYPVRTPLLATILALAVVMVVGRETVGDVASDEGKKIAFTKDTGAKGRNPT
ncbi:O-antigen ligase family protein [Qipengyuania oceanensis]|uniref:O-antigen polymerase n=1 Tax=Qipengyuania oceanensis TaxID=1463597 RepID=A0A844YG45_9SPHN|nr:O-antigen ligase family protein [Qipengyuania oceanensis]MXO63121.1 O-antigen polymerase [Qipengyuania oceanensis]